MTKVSDSSTGGAAENGVGDGTKKTDSGLASALRKFWELFTSTRFWQVAGGIAAVLAVVIPLASSCSEEAQSPDGQDASSVTQTSPVTPAPVTPTPVTPTPRYWGSAIASGPDWWGMKFAEWADAPQERAEIALHMQLGASALHGVAFARVPEPSFANCWDATYDTTRLMLDEIPSGTSVCVRTEAERIGMIRFTWAKEPDGYPRSIEVSGVIWEPRK